jgi:hypothetical protein
MKIKLIGFFAALLFLPLLGVGWAQAEADQIVTANIPFNFYVGDQQKVAGNYEVGVDVANRVIVIRDHNGRNGSFLTGIVGDTGRGAQPIMAFDHVGDSYFLRDVKTTDTDVSFPTQKLERELIARNNSAEQVVVALNMQ